MTTMTIHAAPSEYVLQKGALQLLEDKLMVRGIKRALIVTGTKSWSVAERFWPVMPTIEVAKYTYAGESSFTEIEKVVELSTTFDAIIAIGGGKVIDLAKAAADAVHKQVIVIPTIASNCAPWTPLSVLYDDTGAFVRYDVYPVSSSLLLVDPEIMLETPKDLFIAGIADTLAKWYEADVQLRHIENKAVPLLISYEAAKQCKELLLAHSATAVAALEQKTINDSFIKVVETMFMYAGMVGGYGDYYGRTAGAHSIHNGLTTLEESHHLLHGMKVGYGIFVQLMLEDRQTEIEKLQPFYKALAIPQSLTDMGLGNISAQQILEVAIKATLPTESIHLMPIGEISSQRVAEAMEELERKMLEK